MAFHIAIFAVAVSACKERPEMAAAPLVTVRAADVTEPAKPTTTEIVYDGVSMPPRPTTAMTGSQFVAETALLSLEEREEAVFREISQGNFPDFLRRLVPIEVKGEIVDAFGTKRHVTATVTVMPDYLAIGSDDDYVRVPMNYYTAARIARGFGFILPTDRIVDAIYENATVRVPPQPLPAGPAMVTNQYFARHNELVQEQLGAYQPGQLVSGIKKDVVLSEKLNLRPGRIVIYGWHQPDGHPIQPLSDAHNAGYADYSHGIRMVNAVVQIDGERRSLYDLISDWRTAPLFASEGRIANIRQLMQPGRQTRLSEAELWEMRLASAH